MAKIKEVTTPLQIAIDIINKTSKYELMHSSSNPSNKEMRSKFANLHDDTIIMISAITSELPEDLKIDTDKYIIALKGLSEQKNLNETRVRFWINLMMPVMLRLANILSEQFKEKEA